MPDVAEENTGKT